MLPSSVGGRSIIKTCRQLMNLKMKESLVEVINLRTLNPLDLKAIQASIQKTGRCLIAHEAPKTQVLVRRLRLRSWKRCFTICKLL